MLLLLALLFHKPGLVLLGNAFTGTSSRLQCQLVYPLSLTNALVDFTVSLLQLFMLALAHKIRIASA
jgi:hypothetical protein